MKRLFFILLILLASCTSAPNLIQEKEGCKFDPTWLEPHAISNEVNNGREANACDFYQYIMENFVAQTAWYDRPQFLEAMPVIGVFNESSFVRLHPTPWGQISKYNLSTCDLDGKIPAVVSDLINEAGQPRPLIAQDGTYTFYDVRMNQTLYDFILDCQLTPANRCLNKEVDATRFPAGGHEMKIAWKILNDEDPIKYIVAGAWVKNPDTGQCSSEVLGMVGFHLVMSTTYHPEMIWSSWTHKDNNPLCKTRKEEGREKTFSYYSNKSTVPINTYVDGEPSNICTTSEAQGPIDENTVLIGELKRSYAQNVEGTVLENYEMLGGLWTEQGVMPALTSEQRGALALAHPELESYYQDNLNCFSCHTYSRPDDALQITHINDVTRNKRRDQTELPQ